MPDNSKPFLPTYYNTKKNDLSNSMRNFEFDRDGNIKLDDAERVLAKALYEETGSKATIDDILGVLGKLQSKLKDPLNGYKDNIVALINSRYSGLERPFKGTYNTAANKHRKLVDQISAAYHRKVANDVICILSEARKTL